MALLYSFARKADLPAQTPAGDFTFGSISADKFRLTSAFPLLANQTFTAYAMLKGTVLLQQVSGDFVNLILRPDDLSEIKLPVKYVIYRGLNINDFLTNNNITDPSTIVKTSGIEIIEKMNIIQQGRAPGTAIPVKALFGYDLTASGTKNIDDFFYKDLSVSSQLFTIDAGIEIGKFYGGPTGTTGKMAGIEIVLHNPEYFPDVAMAKMAVNELDVSGITDAIAKKWKKEQIRHFIDPVAFYGLHHDIDGGIGYIDGTTKKHTSGTAEVQSEIQSPFATKNTVYLDIRNENGYSYNYYSNYVGPSSDTVNKDHELKIGNTSTSLVFEEYYTDGWPIHIANIGSPATTGNENTFYIALRINDNEKPLVAVHNTSKPATATEDAQVRFVDETSLLPSSVGEWTNAFSLAVPNIPGSSPIQPATIVRLDYIKQLRLADGVDSFPYQNPADNMWGPANTVIPWNSAENIQWISANNYKYYDGLNNGFASGTMDETIISLDPALKTIKIAKALSGQVTDTVEIINAGSSPNAGVYKVINVVASGSNETTITVEKPFPSVIQSGDKLKLKIEVSVKIDYTSKKLIVPNLNLSSIQAFDNGKKITLYTKRDNSTMAVYSISTRTMVGSDTILAISQVIQKRGLGAIMETGMVTENNTDPNKNCVLFYAVPRNYFRKTGSADTNFFNYKGGTNNNDSFIKQIQKSVPDFEVVVGNLQITTGNFIATLSTPVNNRPKPNILLLGITQNELNTLTVAAASVLSSYHIQMFKLIPQGNWQRDLDYEVYYKYKLVITGLDNSGSYTETTAGIYVYTRDAMIFVSSDYAKKEFISEAVATNALDLFLNNQNFSQITNATVEEEQNLSISWNSRENSGKSNKELFNLDPQLTNLVGELRSELDIITANPVDIKNLLIQKGANLITLARQRIRQLNVAYKNRDGILYLVRLMMQVILKNHPKTLGNFPSKIKEFSEAFELSSRGLSGTAKASFESYLPSSNYIKVLISGFDPFGDGQDGDKYQSNPSGNIALALDGITFPVGNKTAIIRSAVFPVKWQNFDNDIAENFFTTFFSDGTAETADMIITFSYGIHYTTSGNLDHNIHLERFAANYQSYGDDNNLDKNDDNSRRMSSNIPKIIKDLKYTSPGASDDQRDLTFIETSLPFEKLKDGTTGFIKVPNNKVVINHGPQSSHLPIPQMSGKTGFLYWKIFGRPIGGGELSDITHKFRNQNIPANLFLNPFQSNLNVGNPELLSSLDKKKPILVKYKVGTDYRIVLVWDSNELKYFNPTSNSSYIPFISWQNFKDTSIESEYQDIRIEARSGSGGNYISNLIYYRVAFLRKKLKPTLPAGHIHVGFNDVDPNALRDNMLTDMLFIINKFLSP